MKKLISLCIIMTILLSALCLAGEKIQIEKDQDIGKYFGVGKKIIKGNGIEIDNTIVYFSGLENSYLEIDGERFGGISEDSGGIPSHIQVEVQKGKITIKSAHFRTDDSDLAHLYKLGGVTFEAGKKSEVIYSSGPPPSLKFNPPVTGEIKIIDTLKVTSYADATELEGERLKFNEDLSLTEGKIKITEKGFLVEEGKVNYKKMNFKIGNNLWPFKKNTALLIADENSDLTNYQGNWMRQGQASLEMHSSKENGEIEVIFDKNHDILKNNEYSSLGLNINNGDSVIIKQTEDIPSVEIKKNGETGSTEITNGLMLLNIGQQFQCKPYTANALVLEENLFANVPMKIIGEDINFVPGSNVVYINDKGELYWPTESGKNYIIYKNNLISDLSSAGYSLGEIKDIALKVWRDSASDDAVFNTLPAMIGAGLSEEKSLALIKNIKENFGDNMNYAQGYYASAIPFVFGKEKTKYSADELYDITSMIIKKDVEYGIKSSSPFIVLLQESINSGFKLQQIESIINKIEKSFSSMQEREKVFWGIDNLMLSLDGHDKTVGEKQEFIEYFTDKMGDPSVRNFLSTILDQQKNLDYVKEIYINVNDLKNNKKITQEQYNLFLNRPPELDKLQEVGITIEESFDIMSVVSPHTDDLGTTMMRIRHFKTLSPEEVSPEEIKSLLNEFIKDDVSIGKTFGLINNNLRKGKKLGEIKQGAVLAAKYGEGSDLWRIDDLDLTKVKTKQDLGKEVGKAANLYVEKYGSSGIQSFVEIMNKLHDNEKTLDRTGEEDFTDDVRDNFIWAMSDQTKYYLIANGNDEMYGYSFEKTYLNLVANKKDWETKIQEMDPEKKRLGDFAIAVASRKKYTDLYKRDPKFFSKVMDESLDASTDVLRNAAFLADTFEEIYKEPKYIQDKEYYEEKFLQGYKLWGADMKGMYGYLLKLDKNPTPKNAEEINRIKSELPEISELETIPEKFVGREVTTMKQYFYENDWYGETVRDMEKDYGMKIVEGGTKYKTTTLEKEINGKKVRLILTLDNSDVKEIIASEEVQIIGVRGHAGSAEGTLSVLRGKTDTEKIIYLGGCNENSEVPSLQRNYPNSYFIADDNTGYGDVNNKVILNLLNGLATGENKWGKIKETQIADIGDEGLQYPHEGSQRLRAFINKIGG